MRSAEKMEVYICGFSGSGKTTALEKLRNRDKEILCEDLDHLIAGNVGVGAQELGKWIQQAGWESFRALEQKLLHQWSDSQVGPAKVLALGGGTLDFINWSQFKELRGPSSRVYLFHLNRPFELCYQVITGDSNRPLGQRPKAELEQLYHERKKKFQQADREFENVDDLVEFICQLL